MTTMSQSERSLLGLAIIDRSLRIMASTEPGSPPFLDALEAIKTCPDQNLVVVSIVGALVHHGILVCHEIGDGETTPADVACTIIGEGYAALRAAIVDRSLSELMEEEA